MKNQWIGLFLLAVMYLGCEGQQKETQHPTPGAFMGMQSTEVPQLLFPELIASSLEEYNGTFSPDGKLFYFTTNTPSKGIICYTKMDGDGRWAAPKVASFSGVYSEYDPLFSPDGKRLYFTSERPINRSDSSGKTNIWWVDPWDTAMVIPGRLEIKDSGAYYSSITHKGDIYFNVWDTGDLYKATKTANGYETAALSDVLNSKNGEGDPFISPNEDYIIFRGYNNSLGLGDLYISYLVEGQWTSPENLGEPINSAYHEMCPYVTTDGRFFIFASNRIETRYASLPNEGLESVRKKHQTADNGALNIYYISADFIEEKRRKHQ